MCQSYQVVDWAQLHHKVLLKKIPSPWNIFRSHFSENSSGIDISRVGGLFQVVSIYSQFNRGQNIFNYLRKGNSFMRINGIGSSSVEAVVGDQMIEFTLINKLITFFSSFFYPVNMFCLPSAEACLWYLNCFLSQTESFSWVRKIQRKKV